MKTPVIEWFLDEVEKTIASIPGEEDLALGCLRADVPLVRAELAIVKDSYIALRKENEELREALLPFALIAKELDKHEKLSREDLLRPIWQFGDCTLSAGAFIGAQAVLGQEGEGGDDD